jgi:hypothetical protein
MPWDDLESDLYDLFVEPQLYKIEAKTELFVARKLTQKKEHASTYREKHRLRLLAYDRSRERQRDHKAAYQRRREYLLTKSKEWYQRNRDKALAKSKEWRIANPERARATERARYQRHRESQIGRLTPGHSSLTNK